MNDDGGRSKSVTRRAYLRHGSAVAGSVGYEVASELTAVQNDRVFRGGPTYAGPLHNCFLTERCAKLCFTDTFSGELFDRQRVSEIVNEGY